MTGKKNKCVICKFPLKIQPTNFKTPDDEMSFGDSVSRYEHKFLRNIYTEKEIRDSDHIKEEAGEEIDEIKNVINKTEIKNISNGYKNVPKFNLKVYAYVYDELICFPRSDIEYETITAKKIFTNVHRLIRGKFHLHHSHITGQIFGYAHDFCNTMLAERETCEIPFIAHNLFGFDLLYFPKAYIAPAWCLK